MNFAPSIYKTGYNNYTEVADIVSWEGQTEIIGRNFLYEPLI